MYWGFGVSDLKYIERNTAMRQLIDHWIENFTADDLEIVFLNGRKGLKNTNDEELSEIYNSVFGNRRLKHIISEMPQHLYNYEAAVTMNRSTAEQMIIDSLTEKNDEEPLRLNYKHLLNSGFKGLQNLNDEEISEMCSRTCFEDRKIYVVVCD